MPAAASLRMRWLCFCIVTAWATRDEAVHCEREMAILRQRVEFDWRI